MKNDHEEVKTFWVPELAASPGYYAQQGPCPASYITAEISFARSFPTKEACHLWIQDHASGLGFVAVEHGIASMPKCEEKKW